jgi:hypothetical protein
LTNGNHPGVIRGEIEKRLSHCEGFTHKLRVDAIELAFLEDVLAELHAVTQALIRSIRIGIAKSRAKESSRVTPGEKAAPTDLVGHS